MAIINLLWQTIILLISSIIQVIGVIVEGISRILFAFVEMLEKAQNRVLSWKTIKKKKGKYQEA